ncbi:methyltransferase domain-containing protein [Podospora conica]|nr:methyltransferase domain-containing protein [Schizothecium conicum]
MLPTPDTSHVPYSRVYEPAEDSFLLLDTLSSPSESAFLTTRFAPPSPPPLVVELGPGSGVVLAFLTAHALPIFGTRAPLTLGVDVNRFACAATAATARKAVTTSPSTAASFLGAVQGDLASPLRAGAVDVLVFNPPYVPTEELPAPPAPASAGVTGGATTFDEDSHLLALSYAGGRDGMETTERVLAGLAGTLAARGVAYVLLCAGNRPEEVKARMRGEGWRAETVGTSGRTAGWERLQVVRIWREG